MHSVIIILTNKQYLHVCDMHLMNLEEIWEWAMGPLIVSAILSLWRTSSIVVVALHSGPCSVVCFLAVPVAVAYDFSSCPLVPNHWLWKWINWWRDEDDAFIEWRHEDSSPKSSQNAQNILSFQTRQSEQQSNPLLLFITFSSSFPLITCIYERERERERERDGAVTLIFEPNDGKPVVKLSPSPGSLIMDSSCCSSNETAKTEKG